MSFNSHKQICVDENQVHKRDCNTALNLAREKYGYNKLKRKDVRLLLLKAFQGTTT